MSGIRDGEFITSAPKASQNKGSILQVRGFYPPAHDCLSVLTPLQLRDGLNRIQFFKPLNAESRKEWLQENADRKTKKGKHLWLNHSDIKVKCISLQGDHILTSLSGDVIQRLMAGNPDDLEG